MSTFYISGIDEAIAKLKSLQRSLQTKIIRKVLRFVSKTLADEVKRTIPVRSGKLKASVKVRATKRSRVKLGTKVLIGEDSRAWYGPQVEFDHHIGAKKLGNKRTMVKGKHTVELAWKRKGPHLQDAAPQMMWDEIAKAVA